MAMVMAMVMELKILRMMNNMDTFEAIKSRRSVKQYDSNFVISKEEEDTLIDLAMQSPSSFNIQHWRVLKIEDKEIRRKVRELSFDQAQVTDASLLYLICADVKAWDKNPSSYWRNAPKAVQDILVPWINPFYSNNEQLQRDEAMRSVGFFAQTLMLSARAMGYDSCPMIGFQIDQVAELIKLPKDHVIGMMLVIGKALQPAWPKPGFVEKEAIFKYNSF